MPGGSAGQWWCWVWRSQPGLCSCGVVPGQHGHTWMLNRRRPSRVMATNVATRPRAAHRHPAPTLALLRSLAQLIRQGWARLGAPVVGRKVPGTRIVAVLSLVVGYLACLYTIGHGTNLDYSDAQSHLTIARRIFDSKAPGFEQLGTVWLPMPHLLLAAVRAEHVVVQHGLGCRNPGDPGVVRHRHRPVLDRSPPRVGQGRAARHHTGGPRESGSPVRLHHGADRAGAHHVHRGRHGRPGALGHQPPSNECRRAGRLRRHSVGRRSAVAV